MLLPLGLFLIIGGISLMNRGKRANEEALACTDEAERQALLAVARKRITWGKVMLVPGGLLTFLASVILIITLIASF